MGYLKQTSGPNELPIHSKLIDAAPEIVGKTIKAVILKGRSRRNPRTQLFLVFADDTHYEVYGELAGLSGLHPGGLAHVREYMAESAQDTFEVLDRKQPGRRRFSIASAKRRRLGSPRRVEESSDR